VPRRRYVGGWFRETYNTVLFFAFVMLLKWCECVCVCVCVYLPACFSANLCGIEGLDLANDVDEHLNTHSLPRSLARSQTNTHIPVRTLLIQTVQRVHHRWRLRWPVFLRLLLSHVLDLLHGAWLAYAAPPEVRPAHGSVRRLPVPRVLQRPCYLPGSL